MMGLAMELLSLLSLLILALSFFSRPTATFARGGGHMDRAHGVFARHLFEESQPRISESRTHGYMSNSELENSMKEFTQRCANISRIYSIGKSVKGIPLWVLEISDKPGQEEAEPAFKFIGNVHGDEPVGRELLIFLANWLCNNYRKDTLATLIVNNVHLHVLPTMNPDGFALRRRGNANNVDLNRDFPDQFYPMNDIVSLRQPETKAIMNWIKERHFTASASLHGGALVANYPWDGSQDTRTQYVACPDDKTFRHMASLYSRSHYNMSLSKEFEGGITNGALWYPVYGGMQDWNYIHGGCFELTLEISDDKWPKANELPVIWEYNRMSMLNLVASLVKTGVHGKIFSSDKGHPLPASVMIKGIDYRVNASRTYGDYHRMLAPGESYEVAASMPGFQSKTTHILLEDEAMSLDFILSPEEDSSKHEEIRKECECTHYGRDRLEVVEFLRGINLGIYLLLSAILLIFCCLLRRKTMFKSLNHRNGHKRPIVV
uniref:Carboxypeptidase SOL1 n=1 Tax=Elaeis guineensis var. tenera TaxID=51953 RepID=A0A6I9QU06_ELAGV|nr:carboxypeptidase SOL1 [Elaeis guineensis]